MSPLSKFLYPAAFTFLPPLSLFSLNYIILLYCNEHDIDVTHWLQGFELSVPTWLLGGSWVFATTSFGYGAYMLWRDGGLSRNSLPLSLFGTHLIITHLHSFLKVLVTTRLGVQLFGAVSIFGTTLLCCLQAYRADPMAGCMMLPLLSLYTITCWMRISTFYRKKTEL